MRKIVKKLISERLRTLLLSIRHHVIGTFMRMLLPVLKRNSQGIVIKNDSERQSDGTGAQIQRQFANFALSHLIGAGYLYNPVQRVAVHPLDPFQTPEDYEAFLTRLNHRFAFSSNVPQGDFHASILKLNTPSFYSLLRAIIKLRVKQQNAILLINEPYRIIEYFPDSYQVVPKALGSTPKSQQSVAHKEIAVHYRQGVGGMAIYPGQSIPREINLDYFVEIIKRIQSENIGVRFSLTIYTDAPSSPLTYVPPTDQKLLWDGSPNFDGSNMHVKSFDFSGVKEMVGIEPTVLSGGDPIDAIIGMSQADFLIMARSSLSFVAGVMNDKGKVYYPPKFWHKPMSRWLSGEDVVQSD